MKTAPWILGLVGVLAGALNRPIETAAAEEAPVTFWTTGYALMPGWGFYPKG